MMELKQVQYCIRDFAPKPRSEHAVHYSEFSENYRPSGAMKNGKTHHLVHVGTQLWRFGCNAQPFLNPKRQCLPFGKQLVQHLEHVGYCRKKTEELTKTKNLAKEIQEMCDSETDEAHVITQKSDEKHTSTQKHSCITRSVCVGAKSFAHEVFDRVCIAQNVQCFASTKKFRCFQTQATVKYFGYCDDFGPMNLASIASFIDLLDQELVSYPSCKIMYCVDPGRRELTNAVFLLGAYMILKQEMSADDVSNRFSWRHQAPIEDFRDATYSEPDFALSLLDCWRGLERGKANGWVRLPSKSGLWGETNMDFYAHYDDPLNGDLHVVVPGKFVAFRGPKNLGQRDYSDEGGCRQFSPGFYAPLFGELGVTTVVRLNEPQYDREAFAGCGIAHHDLAFDDCSSPPESVVRAFFDIVDAAPGVVAVHCKAGLGRTGTLIALHLMRSRGFSAREAMGWLRIARPGSVIGEQQHYLCAAERAARASGPEAAAAGPAAHCAASCGAAALATQVSAAAERRCAVHCGASR